MSITSHAGKQWNERSNGSSANGLQLASMFGLLFDQMADAVWLLDPESGVVRDCNRAAVRWLLHSDKSVLLGKPWHELAPPCQACGTASVELACACLGRARESGTHRFDWLVRRRDESTFPLDVVLTAVPSSEAPLLVAIARDISARKRAEEQILRLNETLEQRVAERAEEFVLANQQLKNEIAERRRAEERLRQSEARARTLVEHAPEAIVVFDESGHFLQANPNADRLYGLSRQDLLGRHPAELSPPIQPDGRTSFAASREYIAKALAGETPVFEWTHRHSSGRLVPCEVRLVRLPSEGRLLIRGSITDNTERRQRERVQTAIFEISQAVDRVSDLDQLYEYIHRVIRSLMPADNFYIALYEPATKLISFPYHVDTFTPQPMPCEVGTGLTGYVLRFGKPLLVDAAMNARKRYVGDQVTFEGFGDIRYFESGVPAAIWLGVPLTTGNVCFGVMAVQDYQNPGAYGEQEKQLLEFVAAQVAQAIQRKRVEARLRESEARLSTAFRATPVLLTITRLSDGHFVEANEAALRWSGYSREEVIGHTSLELGLWEDVTERDRFWSELRAKGFLRDRECRFRNRGGTVHTLSISGEIIEIDNEPHLLMASQDVTQRNRAAEELLKSLAREKELGQLRSSFVSMVSHEFRTPLGVIQSSAEILQDYFDRLEPQERQEHLRSIQDNTRRMASLMEEVLLLGRFEAGKMELRRAPLDLAVLAQRVASEVETATEQRCSITCSTEGIVSRAQADKRLLHHIFLNLLTNAVKYSDPGQAVRFTIARDGTDALCTIQDEGAGIPEADLQYIFQAFHRGSNVGDRPGTGLGLVIVKRCVDLHEGKIQVQSQLGVGTKVTVRLPLFP